MKSSAWGWHRADAMEMNMNEGSFHHAWGGSPVADTLGAGASPSHSAPGVLAPWMLAVLVRKCLAA